MDLEEVNHLAKGMMKDRKSHPYQETGDAYYHGQRVACLAVELRKKVAPESEAEDSVLIAAAWLHDGAKGLEPHNRYGAILAWEGLKGICTQRQRQQIVALIENHTKKRGPHSSLHLKLLQDANVLDQYGSLAIWRDFWFSCYQDQPLQETAALDWNRWQEHCKKQREALHFSESQEAFDEKVIFLGGFYERLLKESRGEAFI